MANVDLPTPSRKRSHFSREKNKNCMELTLTSSCMNHSKMYVSSEFMREHKLDSIEEITLMGKDGTKTAARILGDPTGSMIFGRGFKPFAKANRLKIGETFFLELIMENENPVLILKTEQGESSEDSKNDPVSTEPSSGNDMVETRDSSSSTIMMSSVLNAKDVINCRLILPSEFMKANGINKAGTLMFCGKTRLNWCGYMSEDGVVAVGIGWKGFCEANDIKIGDTYKLESVGEEASPTLRLSKSSSGNTTTEKAKNNGETSRSKELERNQCLPNSRLVTLTLELEDAKAGKLHFPRQFMESNGINKLGEIIFLGENEKEWSGYLLSKIDGTVALGSGWNEFCEANGVKLGNSFSLEFISEQHTATPVLKFRSNSL